MFKNLSFLLVITLLTFSSCDNSNPILKNIKNLIAPNNITVEIAQSNGANQGQSEGVDIRIQNIVNDNFQFGKFEFFITYDASALTFQSAAPGQFLVDCGWEYFTYRYINGDSCTNCLSGGIRITAIAETNNGAGNHPVCFNTEGSISNQLAVLQFLVTNDRSFECHFAPIQFSWYECDDNIIVNTTNDTTFYASGLSIAESNACESDKMISYIDFVDGGIDIFCSDSIDGRGDLNLNKIANEVADVVLYASYFVYGQSVFSVNLNGHLAASDVNADGETLTVADLVYLIRIVVGDALPYPNSTINTPQYVNGTYTYYQNGNISIENDLHIAAAQLVVEGNITPTLLAENMTMMSNFDGVNTNILIFSIENNNFTGNMVNIGNANIISLEMADELGIPVKLNILPTQYSLGYNYPNPFNPVTTIEIGIPVVSEVTFEVRNINNQIVYAKTETYEAGVHKIEFDGSNLSSGSYSYTIRANGFEDTKIMNLLK